MNLTEQVARAMCDSYYNAMGLKPELIEKIWSDGIAKASFKRDAQAAKNVIADWLDEFKLDISNPGTVQDFELAIKQLRNPDE